MDYLWISYQACDIDEPSDRYVELGEDRLERRRIDLYEGGMRYLCGGELGREEVLSKTPYPENPFTLNRPGELEVRRVAKPAFEDLWNRSLEWPSGFLDMTM